MFMRYPLMNEAGDASSGGGSSDEVIEAQGQVEESSDEGELTPAEVKKIKKLKLKFNGKEIEEDLPFEIEESHADWLVKQRQKAMLADHKANEYAQLENEIGNFIKELRINPKKALSNPLVGLDIKQFAAQILQEEIEQAQKSPEQIERERLEEELRQMREEREREKQEMSARELERLTEREYERYDSLMSEAIENSDLPKSPYVVKKMTELMMLGIENGIDVSPADVIPLIRDEIHNDIQEMFQSMPTEVIEQLIGKANLDKLRKKRVAAAKPPVPVRSSIQDTGSKKEEKVEDKKPQTIRDFLGV